MSVETSIPIESESNKNSKSAINRGPYILIILLLLASGYLFYENYKFKKQLDEVNARLDNIDTELSDINFELSSVTSELIYTTSLAENANNYAHSHYSDKRLKQDIRPLEGSLERLLELQGVSFNFNANVPSYTKLPEGIQIGLIAQEVNKIFPELVSIGPDGYLQVNYQGLLPIMLEAIKEQQKQIDALEIRLTIPER